MHGGKPQTDGSFRGQGSCVSLWRTPVPRPPASLAPAPTPPISSVVAAMNPYECGFSGGPNLECHCGQTNVQCYRERSTGLCSTEDSGVKRALETFLLDFRSFHGMGPPMKRNHNFRSVPAHPTHLRASEIRRPPAPLDPIIYPGHPDRPSPPPKCLQRSVRPQTAARIRRHPQRFLRPSA